MIWKWMSLTETRVMDGVLIPCCFTSPMFLFRIPPILLIPPYSWLCFQSGREVHNSLAHTHTPTYTHIEREMVTHLAADNIATFRVGLSSMCTA